jgi:hypothetical protein
LEDRDEVMNPFTMLRPLKLLAVLLLFPAILQAEQHEQQTSDSSVRITALESKHKHLQQDTSDLLKRLTTERTKILEEMRKEVRGTMVEWENDPSYLNGKGLKAALFNAEAVAEGYGFDVEKLPLSVL